MNTHLRSTFRTSAMLVLGAGLALPAAMAGLGPQYWNSAHASAEIKAAPGSTEPISRTCTDARWVTVTEAKPSWHNGRGPLVTTEVGKKLECSSCDTPIVVMKPSGHNGRGAMMPIEIRGKHTCSTNDCGAEIAKSK